MDDPILGTDTSKSPQQQGNAASDDDVDDSRAALVTKWLGRVKSSKTKFKDDFKRMRENEYLARQGATKEWVDSHQYKVAITNRHINQAVAQLYARNPTVEAKSRKQLRYKLWDGRQDTLNAAMDQATMGDPNAVGIVNDVIQGRMQEELINRMGQTAKIVCQYFFDEQANGFKKQMKAAVRRTKVSSVSYIKLAFQRVLEPRPEIQAKIDDCTSQIAATERLLKERAEGEFSDGDAQVEELRLLLRQLQDQLYLVVREGPVYDFPRSSRVIPDTSCTHLKTLSGARWVAVEYPLTADEIRDIYGVSVKGSAKPMNENPEAREGQSTAYNTNFGTTSEDQKENDKYLVYEIQDKQNSQFLTVCEGYRDFLKEPAEPDVKISRFFTLFPIVFNEAESEDHLYPPSDVELLEDTQMEYNRSRQGLREHRQANRPFWVTSPGVLTDEDRQKLGAHGAHTVFTLANMAPGAKAEDLIRRGPVANIDPAQYDVGELFADMERIVGTQQADLGSPGDTTATEASIVEQGRGAGLSDQIDDLDEVLSDLAKATGEVLLLEMSKEAVIEIAGPGAVWPDAPPTRQQISQDLYLDIKAGSSGRPNAAAELAKLERAMPLILAMQGLNPRPIQEKMLGLLDVDVEASIAEGAPSITAMNALLAKMQQPGGMPPGGGGPVPGAQGPQGAMNAPAPATPQGPQPAHPAPMPGPSA